MKLYKRMVSLFSVLAVASVLSIPANAYDNGIHSAIGNTVTASAADALVGGSAASAANKNAADYTYTVTPLLYPFNEYFFVETDNPDPLSFRFADPSSAYSDESTVIFDYDTWDEEVKLYADIVYENEETGRVNGGYIFKSFNTDGGELVLQSRKDLYLMGEAIWEDTNVRLTLPVLKDDVDYLIDTYADRSGFFENMDAVESGFSSICLYSGSYIRGKLIKPNDYWCAVSAGHIDQSFYIYSPYDREDNEALFASAIYPFRYDSLGFPSMMAAVADRLDSASVCKWNSDYHYLIDVTYAGETRSYGGAGTGEGQGISEDKIRQYFTFGAGKTEITLQSAYQLLQEYAAIEMADDIPREDALTWEKIYADVGEGSWARILGSNMMIDGKFSLSSPDYAYFYQKGDGTYFSADEWSDGYSLYWGGDLGYARDTWVDGRYVGEWRTFVMGERFEDHPTSNLLLNQVQIPQIEYRTVYEYNSSSNEYDRNYQIMNITEKTQTVLFRYEDGIWKADYNAFDDGCAYYDVIADLVESGLIDEKYLDMVTLTLEEVTALEVDKNTNTVPMSGFVYDGTDEPGTSYAYQYGDVDCDESITATDSLMTLRAVVDLEYFYDTERTLADVDGDGNITAADALYILRRVVGLIDYFPAEE